MRKAWGKLPSATLESALAPLLEAWRDSHPVDAEWESLCEHITKGGFYLPVPLIASVLEPAGRYSQLLRFVEIQINLHSKKMVDETIGPWITETRRKESAGEMAAAGVRYLSAGDKQAAMRCWTYVDVTENNLQCMIEAGLQEKAIEFFERTQQFFRAALITMEMKQPQRSVEYFRKSKLESSGAATLEQNKFYAEAAQLYESTGDLSKAATLMEKKLKQYEEAARLWESAGNPQRAQACYRRAKGNHKISSRHRDTEVTENVTEKKKY